MYFSNDDLQRPFGSISGILVFLVCWFEETLRGAKYSKDTKVLCFLVN